MRNFVILFMFLLLNMLKTTTQSNISFVPTDSLGVSVQRKPWCHFTETSVGFTFFEGRTYDILEAAVKEPRYVCLCQVFNDPKQYRLIARFCDGNAQDICSAANTTATPVQHAIEAADSNLVTCNCNREDDTHSKCECYKSSDGASDTANDNCISTHVSLTPLALANSESLISPITCWRSNSLSATTSPTNAEIQFCICHEASTNPRALCYQHLCQGDRINPTINYCSIPSVTIMDSKPDITCQRDISLDAKTDYHTTVMLPNPLLATDNEDGDLHITFNDSRITIIRSDNQQFIQGLLPIGRTTILAMAHDFTQNRVNCKFTISIKRVCEEGEILCDNGLACIPIMYKCNGWPDCRDQSDEDREKCFVAVGDECPSSPCLHGGTCNVTNADSYNRYRGGYKCQCQEGYTGINCEEALDKCAMLGNICINGNCSFDTANGVACDCFQGWTGTGCDRRIIDKCAMIGNICKNGECFFDEINGFSCKCSPGWTGTGCDRPVETNSSGESSAQLSNVTTGLTGAGVVIIISLTIITIVCLRYRHIVSSGRSNSSTGNKGAFTNTIYGDGERDSDIVVPIQSHAQIQSNKSEEYQGLSNRPKQDPYQDLKKIKARPNSYDDNNYIDPNEVNGRGSRRPTAPADDEAEYIDVDSEIQRAKPSYGTGNSKEGNATSNVDPDYFQLEKPSTNGDPVYLQLEKENIESAQVGDENLQDYDRLAAGTGANPPREGEGQKNTTGGDDTYQHLKSNVSPVADNDDYQHLKRDGF